MKKYLFFLIVVVVLVGSCKSDFVMGNGTVVLSDDEIVNLIKVTGVYPNNEQGRTLIGWQINHSYTYDLLITVNYDVNVSADDINDTTDDEDYIIYSDSFNKLLVFDPDLSDGNTNTFNIVSIIGEYLDANSNNVKITRATAKPIPE